MPADDTTMNRKLLSQDLTHCAWHPEVASAGWGDVKTEDGEIDTVGLCAGCLLSQGGHMPATADAPAVALVTLSPGLPCKCGPGFCASARGLGYFGFCCPTDRAAAPDCQICGAPHQGVDGCWLCSTRSGNDPDGSSEWLLALSLGVDGDDAFRAQKEAWARGESLTFEEAIRQVAASAAGKE